MKKLSIFITAYNCEKTIKKAVDSCLKQTVSEVSIHIIDDGSTDQTGSIARHYVKEHPGKVFYHYKENGGVASARNKALSLADSEYFTFLDGDDWLDEEMAEKMLGKAEESDADIVYSDFYYSYPGKEERYHEERYTNSEEMIVHLNASLWNKIYKTELIKKTGIGFIDKSRFEDTSFLYKLAPFVSSVAYVDDAFLHYVQREGSLVHVYDKKVLQVLDVFEDLFEFYKEKHIFEKYREELEYTTIRYMLGQPFRYCAKIEDKKEAKEAMDALWSFLNRQFPNWKKNPYLRKERNAKNIYFSLVNKRNYRLFGALFGR